MKEVINLEAHINSIGKFQANRMQPALLAVIYNSKANVNENANKIVSFRNFRNVKSEAEVAKLKFTKIIKDLQM